MKAYTLVELVVVMGIFAVLIAFGVLGLNAFLRSSQVNTAANDFLTTVKSDIQRARSSVYTQQEIEQLRNGWENTCSFAGQENFPPEAIGYFFGEGKRNFIKCSTNSSLEYDFCCVRLEEYPYSFVSEQEDILFQPQGDCKGVIFEYSTGEVYSFAGDNLSLIRTSDSDCTVVLRHSQKQDETRRILFDVSNNNVRIQN